MPNAWNYERRRVVCAKFLVGVSLVAKGEANASTSLEAVRNRMRLPPEDALFAARRLSEEQLIGFDPGGAVRSTSEGIVRAAEILRSATSQTDHADDVRRTLRGGGMPFEMLKIALMANGGVLDCGARESEAGTVYRLGLAGEVITLERKTADGAFEPVPESAS